MSELNQKTLYSLNQLGIDLWVPKKDIALSEVLNKTYKIISFMADYDKDKTIKKAFIVPENLSEQEEKLFKRVLFSCVNESKELVKEFSKVKLNKLPSELNGIEVFYSFGFEYNFARELVNNARLVKLQSLASIVKNTSLKLELMYKLFE